MHKFIWFILCLFAFVGCRTQRSLFFGDGQGVGVVMPDTTTFPTLPAEALYVLGAQWEADSMLQQCYTIAEYMEQELMRLYPEKAYHGYVQRLCAMTDSLLMAEQRTPTLFAPQRQEITFASANAKSVYSSLYFFLASASASSIACRLAGDNIPTGTPSTTDASLSTYPIVFTLSH